MVLSAMLDFLIYYRGLFQHLLIFGLTLFALVRADGPEKFSSLTLSLMVLLDYLYHFIFPRGGVYEAVEIGHLVIDTSALISFAFIAAKANRMYPLWLLGAQLMSVMMHFNREISEEMPGMVYLVLTRFPSYIQIIAMAVGLYCHRRRIARYGSYRSWRIS